MSVSQAVPFVAFWFAAQTPSLPVYEKSLPSDHEAIDYWQAPREDPASALLADPSKLRFEKDFGYLRSLLDALDVPAASQTLVFSKSSLQRAHISPDRPRAIYFGDRAAVGYVPGGHVLEILSVDPKLGAILYTLDNRDEGPARFERPKICIACHQAPATLGVPGGYVGSLLTNPSGEPTYRGSIVTDHRTPIAERWGGWFVSPAELDFEHRGNAVLAGPAGTELDPLPTRFDGRRYLHTNSDVVALMILEHQTQMLNLLTRLGWEARMGTANEAIDARIEQVVEHLILSGEAPLPSPLKRVSTFADTFERSGRLDRDRRSLRELDLETNLFRYPLSFVVESETFGALPPDVRTRVYERLLTVLRTASPAAIEILADTADDLPNFWPRRARD